MTNNLITTFKQLARYRPAEAERYLLGSLELVTELYQARDHYRRVHPDPQTARLNLVEWLKNLLFLRMELAKLNPARAAEHVAASWQGVAELRRFADEMGDPDLQREAIQAEHYVRDGAGSAPGSPASQPDGEIPSAEALVRRLSEAVLGARKAACDVLALSTGAPRYAAVAQYLEQRYADLERAFHPEIQELGINHHVSRVLLALGAVASGRLWPLSRPAAEASVCRPPDDGDRDGPMHRREQQMASRHMFNLSANYPSLVCAVAAFSDVLSQEAELAGVLKQVLREQNGKLLEHLLPVAVQPQHVPGRRMSTRADVAAIAWLIGNFPGHHVPRPRREGPARSAPPEGDDAALLEVPDNPAPSDGPYDFEQWLAPERMIGRVTSFWDLKKKAHRDIRIDSILGQGTEKVVFGVTTLDTGERMGLALFRTAFGPGVVLRDYLNRVSDDRETYNPQSVLTICEAGLASHPGDLIFAFNKSVALAMKGDLTGAGDALDVALATAPDDLQCLVHKAGVLSLLGQHSGAVMHLARASRLHPDAFRELLDRMTDLRGQLASSVGAILQADPRRPDAGDLMREYFSAPQA